jgi:hypothetical protein
MSFAAGVTINYLICTEVAFIEIVKMSHARTYGYAPSIKHVICTLFLPLLHSRMILAPIIAKAAARA